MFRYNTPSLSHPPAAGLPCMVLVTGDTLDSTRPYKSTPGDNIIFQRAKRYHRGVLPCELHGILGLLPLATNRRKSIFQSFTFSVYIVHISLCTINMINSQTEHTSGLGTKITVPFIDGDNESTGGTVEGQEPAVATRTARMRRSRLYAAAVRVGARLSICTF